MAGIGKGLHVWPAATFQPVSARKQTNSRGGVAATASGPSAAGTFTSSAGSLGGHRASGASEAKKHRPSASSSSSRPLRKQLAGSAVRDTSGQRSHGGGGSGAARKAASEGEGEAKSAELPGEAAFEAKSAVCDEANNLEKAHYMTFLQAFKGRAGDGIDVTALNSGRPGLREGEFLPTGLRPWDDRGNPKKCARDNWGAGWCCVHPALGRSKWFNIRIWASWRLAFLLARLQRKVWELHSEEETGARSGGGDAAAQAAQPYQEKKAAASAPRAAGQGACAGATASTRRGGRAGRFKAAGRGRGGRPLRCVLKRISKKSAPPSTSPGVAVPAASSPSQAVAAEELASPEEPPSPAEQTLLDEVSSAELAAALADAVEAARHSLGTPQRGPSAKREEAYSEMKEKRRKEKSYKKEKKEKKEKKRDKMEKSEKDEKKQRRCRSPSIASLEVD